MSTTIADTITPLISANFVYLFLLNAGIGWFEGKLLRRWSNGKIRAVWWMIAANYLSAWVGFSLIIWQLDPRLEHLLAPRPIERVNHIALLLLAFSFATTVVIEWLPVYFATNPSRRSIARSLGATVLVNAASYVVICLLFMWVSFTLPMNARVMPMAQLGPMTPGRLFFVDPSGQLMMQRLDQPDSLRKVGQVMLNDFVQPDHLDFQPEGEGQSVRLIVRYSTTTYRDRQTPAGLVAPEDPLLIANVAMQSSFPSDYWTQSHFMRKSALDLRPSVNRPQMSVHFDWYRHYLQTDVDDGPDSRLCIGLAAFEWDLREPTVLPDGNVIFEWDRQILLFDPRTRGLAFIANGTCPAFVPR